MRREHITPAFLARIGATGRAIDQLNYARRKLGLSPWAIVWPSRSTPPSAAEIAHLQREAVALRGTVARHQPLIPAA